MLRVLVVDGDPVQRDLVMSALRRSDDTEVVGAASGSAALEVLQRRQIDMLIVDLALPDHDGWWALQEARLIEPRLAFVVLASAVDTGIMRRALVAGALDVFEKRWTEADELERLKLAVEKARRTVALTRRAEAASAGIERRAREQERLIGSSVGLERIRSTIEAYRDADMAVLLEGPTGVGKEVVAKTIHAHSRFAKGPFVAINVPALSSELLASELFGHVRGAFTGAERDRVGAFEQANHGTLFLDEIGDLQLGLQAQLLRVLESKEICRVGSSRAIALDVHVVAATNRGLMSMVEAGTFRRDLYYRLSQVRIEIPPLRERLDDIAELAEHFLATSLKRCGRQQPQRFSGEALALMREYGWPGNVRELRNLVERLVFTTNGVEVDALTIERELRPFSEREEHTRSGVSPSLKDRLRELEITCVREALEASAGNITRAARLAGEAPGTFYARGRRLGLITKAHDEERSVAEDDGGRSLDRP